MLKDQLTMWIIVLMIFLIQLFFVTLMVMVFLAQYSVKFAMCLEELTK